ncbi:MAG: hypothetical protein ABWY25_03420 [Paenisporosarcina sp.]
MYDKIIVTNREPLVGKYGTNGFKTIGKALDVLANADERLGIKTRILHLDDRTDMKKVGGKAVTNTLDPRENKEAVDSVFKFYNPHYLMILGSPDVLPHQDLDNPTDLPGDDIPGDGDAHAWGDLPYACEAPYSQDPARFIGPTRVVGRLPDLVGANKPSFLISLLKTASAYKMRSPDDYTGYLGLSAEVWKGSTRLSLDNIFGNSSKLLLAPPSGPNYSNGELHNLMHFINCHGADGSPEFYGQHGGSYPVSLTTDSITGAIVKGTVAAVECCYGAQLYDSVTLGIDQPICQSYLQQGAYGYFGSTTIAYGPWDTNAQADLICQYFLLKVLEGASLGHAALMARQLFVRDTAQMDAMDLKTLAQFCLLGDPSVHPIAKHSPTGVPTGKAKADAERYLRAERRQKMKLAGEFLTETKPTAARRLTTVKLSQTTKAKLATLASNAGLPKNQRFKAYAVDEKSGTKGQDAEATTSPLIYLIAIGNPERHAGTKIKTGVAIVVKVLNGRVIGYRIYRQR